MSASTQSARVGAAQRARRAWRQLAVLVPLVVGVLVLYDRRRSLFHTDTPVRITASVALVILGWASARAAGRAVAPAVARRGVPVSGPLGFVVRLATLGIALIVALRVVGLNPSTLAAGGAITAIILGLAAQQTLGNLFAGIVLLSARPFRVGERVRLQGGPLGGPVEGHVVDAGLLYSTLSRGDDKILVPNSLVLNSVIVPLREPGAVDVRVRLQPDVSPTELQARLEQSIRTPVRSSPHIHLEEVDPNEVVLRVTAVPASAQDGAQLADEVLGALREVAVDSDSRAVRAAARGGGPAPG
ncbi:MAG TPA: mechanosensitive ion channel domain-containing protein [Acidimicrobiia bacterium]|nr:mechanosensitive ion channel domain-containing protein [Acidimicrobiia bacterium]